MRPKMNKSCTDDSVLDESFQPIRISSHNHTSDRQNLWYSQCCFEELEIWEERHDGVKNYEKKYFQCAKFTFELSKIFSIIERSAKLWIKIWNVKIFICLHDIDYISVFKSIEINSCQENFHHYVIKYKNKYLQCYLFLTQK